MTKAISCLEYLQQALAARTLKYVKLWSIHAALEDSHDTAKQAVPERHGGTLILQFLSKASAYLSVRCIAAYSSSRCTRPDG